MAITLSTIKHIGAAVTVTALQSCSGILNSVYDEPQDPEHNTIAGQLYIDASDWGKWHFLNLPGIVQKIATDSLYNPNSAWQSFDIPMSEIAEPVKSGDGSHFCGIYTYWYDVFGAGIQDNEFRSFMPTAAQPQPEEWTFAVHRNNVMTNGCSVAMTGLDSFDKIPFDESFLKSLFYKEDEWTENEVWCEQSRMLLGLIGNQGISINRVLSSWLSVEIPPIPPAFTICNDVFIVKLPDETYAALQLENYQSPTGTKCCLTINYRYPL